MPAKSSRIKVKTGDVFEIPLPNGKFAYGRVYDDAGVGIYQKISSKSGKPPIGSREFMFNVGLYADILKTGTWKIVGKDPFIDGESTFPPPYCIKDKINGRFALYHKGEVTPASEKECQGLEEAAAWDSHHVIDRIMTIIER